MMEEIMPTETEKAWMAGFLDGEGTFTICKQVRKNRPSPAYRVFISVSNTDKYVLKIFCRYYGGKIYNVHERRKDKRGLKWRDAFDWYCPVFTSERFLIDVLPYLRLKYQQAEVLLEFLRTKQAFARKKRTSRGSAPLTDEEIAHRERLRLKVQALNKKGVYSRYLEVMK
ncbi:MAG: LAGLIDADG family homing endonuclease [Nitrososphaeria archaeon]